MAPIPYVKQTWTDGSSSASAARLAVIEQGVEDAHKMPCARAYHSAVQTVASSTWTALAFNSERFDTDTIHDTATNNSRLTCKTAGVYLIGGHCQLDSVAGGTQRLIDIILNGTSAISGGGLIASAFPPDPSAPDAFLNTVTIYKLAVNDYVELRVFHDIGSTRNVNASLDWSPEFWMTRIASG
jgi:hypothetical protein